LEADAVAEDEEPVGIDLPEPERHTFAKLLAEDEFEGMRLKSTDSWRGLS
jgi:hypothetical protein